MGNILEKKNRKGTYENKLNRFERSIYTGTSGTAYSGRDLNKSVYFRTSIKKKGRRHKAQPTNNQITI